MDNFEDCFFVDSMVGNTNQNYFARDFEENLNADEDVQPSRWNDFNSKAEGFHSVKPKDYTWSSLSGQDSISSSYSNGNSSLYQSFYESNEDNIAELGLTRGESLPLEEVSDEEEEDLQSAGVGKMQASPITELFHGINNNVTAAIPQMKNTPDQILLNTQQQQHNNQLSPHFPWLVIPQPLADSRNKLLQKESSSSSQTFINQQQAILSQCYYPLERDVICSNNSQQVFHSKSNESYVYGGGCRSVQETQVNLSQNAANQTGFDYFRFYKQQNEQTSSTQLTSSTDVSSSHMCESTQTVSLNDLGQVLSGEKLEDDRQLLWVASNEVCEQPHLIRAKIDNRERATTINWFDNHIQQDFNQGNFYQTAHQTPRFIMQQEEQLEQQQVLTHRNSSCDEEQEEDEERYPQKKLWEKLLGGFKVEEGDAQQQLARETASTLKEVEEMKLCNKKNVVKNIMNAFKNFVLDTDLKNETKVNQRITELYNAGKIEGVTVGSDDISSTSNDDSSQDSLPEIVKKFRRYINAKNFNHYSIRLLILHPNYGPILKYFLTGPAYHWISSSKVNDHDAHFVMINFLSLSCADVSVIDQLKRHEKKKAHYQ